MFMPILIGVAQTFHSQFFKSQFVIVVALLWYFMTVPEASCPLKVVGFYLFNMLNEDFNIIPKFFLYIKNCQVVTIF